MVPKVNSDRFSCELAKTVKRYCGTIEKGGCSEEIYEESYAICSNGERAI